MVREVNQAGRHACEIVTGQCIRDLLLGQRPEEAVRTEQQRIADADAE